MSGWSPAAGAVAARYAVSGLPSRTAEAEKPGVAAGPPDTLVGASPGAVTLNSRIATAVRCAERVRSRTARTTSPAGTVAVTLFWFRTLASCFQPPSPVEYSNTPSRT